MAKIEKTLELNITHEILSLADGFWWFLQPVSLKKYWRPHWRFPFIATPKSFATGLHINLEGKQGGGYDVCINSPSNFQGGNPRLLFMQFKAGAEHQFNSDVKSIFYGNKRNPNVHVEFGINNNSNKNQHRLLAELALRAGNLNAVVYVFPRIINEAQLQNNIGRLLTRTSFISIADIDAKATNNNVKIDDGKAHKFRTCYNDFNKNEVNFFLFRFGRPTNPGGLLGEIFAIRMYRALQTIKIVLDEKYPISRDHIVDAMIKHLLSLGLHFSIPLATVEEFLKQYRDVSDRLNYLYDYEDLLKIYQIETETNQYVIEIFNDILKSLSQYFKWIEQVQYFESSEIPKPPADYTIELNNDNIRFDIKLTEFNANVDPEDFDEITYSLF